MLTIFPLPLNMMFPIYLHWVFYTVYNSLSLVCESPASHLIITGTRSTGLCSASSRPGQTGREKWINNQPWPEPVQRGRDVKIARIRIICIHILTVEFWNCWLLATKTRVSTTPRTLIQGKMLRPGLARLPLSIDARVTAASAHIGGCQPPEAGTELWPGSRVSHTLPPLMPALSLPASLVSSLATLALRPTFTPRQLVTYCVLCTPANTRVVTKLSWRGSLLLLLTHWCSLASLPRPPDTIVAVSAQFPPCVPDPARPRGIRPSPAPAGLA